MIQKFKKFTALPLAEKMLFIEAYLTLGTMRAAILTVSFKRLTRSMAQHPKELDMPTPSDGEARTAITIGQAISRAAAYTPWESACLAQSLTAKRMLQKRGIGGVFYLGVNKKDGTMSGTHGRSVAI